ncbi:hypothetical protein AKJ16_DCAP25668, partial [Drosera capensis]
MATAAGIRPWLFLLAVSVTVSLSVASSSDELALVVGETTVLEVVPSVAVRDSPGAKLGLVVGAARVRVYGLSRMKYLKKYLHSVKLKVSYSSSSPRQPNVEVCFHRNFSVAVGMCPQGQWEKLSKGSWDHTMSPFDHKILDVRAVGLSSTVLEVTLEEEFFMYRVMFLILGILLMTVAPTLSSSLVFYYSSAMAVGIILVILVLLFQGMKLLPTGRRSTIAVLMYSSIIGVGSFVMSYLSGFLRTAFVQLGISEDMYNPLGIFLLLFIILFGAWMGFWAVRKFILTEDGLVDTSVAQFATWSIRILAAAMILLSSVDALLASLALLCSIVVQALLRRTFRPKVLHRLNNGQTRYAKAKR